MAVAHSYCYELLISPHLCLCSCCPNTLQAAIFKRCYGRANAGNYCEFIPSHMCAYLIGVQLLIQIWDGSVKVMGYSCARRVKCIGKCIVKLANQRA